MNELSASRGRLVFQYERKTRVSVATYIQNLNIRQGKKISRPIWRRMNAFTRGGAENAVLPFIKILNFPPKIVFSLLHIGNVMC